MPSTSASTERDAGAAAPLRYEPSVSHDESVIQELRNDPLFAAEYLRAALEDEEEPRVLLIALRHIAEAKGGIAHVAKVAGIERESLYRPLRQRQPTILNSGGRHQSRWPEAHRGNRSVSRFRWCSVLVLVAFLSAATLHAQTAYTLPPEKLHLAQALFRTRTLLHFAGAAWGILQIVVLLALRVPPRLRDIVQRTSRNRWAQCFLFTFLLLLLVAVLDLPLGIYGHHLSLAYGLSVQGWPGWFADLAKQFVLDWGPTGLGAMLLFYLIRRSPRRWWLWFWFPAMAAVFAGVFISPILIDPLFSHFEPLTAHDPALVTRLEQVVARGPLSIPPDRMFWMDASKRYTGLNAYVTGLGPSKRVVVWDTSIAGATPEQIAFIFGHEMGHYVLDHIYWTLLFLGALLLLAFWIGFHASEWLLRRYGMAWSIRGPTDWAALPVYMVILAVFTFASEPLVNVYSRAHEHAADIYGQEAMHTLVPDPQATAVQTFRLLGEKALESPEPHPFIEWWSYTHPAIHTRAAFAATYNPWAPGQQPRYFAK